MSCHEARPTIRGCVRRGVTPPDARGRREETRPQARRSKMPHTLTVGCRSRFVTATAWVFIVLAGLASASAIVQNAAVASLLPGLEPMNGAAPLPLLTG